MAVAADGGCREGTASVRARLGQGGELETSGDDRATDGGGGGRARIRLVGGLVGGEVGGLVGGSCSLLRRLGREGVVEGRSRGVGGR